MGPLPPTKSNAHRIPGVVPVGLRGVSAVGPVSCGNRRIQVERARTGGVVGGIAENEQVRAAERAKRDAKVVRLVVLGGFSYREAADAVGLRSPASVHAIVQRALADDGGRRELLASEAGSMFVERSEALLVANWPAAMRGDYDAGVICGRVIDAQARVFGLYGS